MKKVLLLAVLFLVSDLTLARTFRVTDKARHLELIGVVRGSAVELAQKIDKLSRESRKDISILINSPGGSVAPGMAVVDSIRMAKERGVRIKCAVGVLAASMAFIILSHCTDRYVLPEAKLLFHPISLSTQGSRVQELVVDLAQTVKQERRIMAGLRKTMQMDRGLFRQHYFAETFWAATELDEETDHANFLKVVKRIEGVGDSLFKYRKNRGIFGQSKLDTKVHRILERFESAGR